MAAYVYILASRPKGILYTGVTTDIGRRMLEHQQGLMAGFTRKYNVHSLVYAERHDRIDEAIQREKAIKKWNRDWKISLIEKSNPEWRDITSSLI